jgi:hypothetical protein
LSALIDTVKLTVPPLSLTVVESLSDTFAGDAGKAPMRPVKLTPGLMFQAPRISSAAP